MLYFFGISTNFENISCFPHLVQLMKTSQECFPEIEKLCFVGGNMFSLFYRENIS